MLCYILKWIFFSSNSKIIKDANGGTIVLFLTQKTIPSISRLYLRLLLKWVQNLILYLDNMETNATYFCKYIYIYIIFFQFFLISVFFHYHIIRIDSNLIFQEIYNEKTVGLVEVHLEKLISILHKISQHTSNY